MEYSCEWVRQNLGEATPSEPFPCEWVKAHWDDETKEAPYPCVALQNYFSTQQLSVTPAAATKDSYWGTAVSAMQSNIAIGGA